MNDNQEILREHLKAIFGVLLRKDTSINDLTIEYNSVQENDGVYVRHIPTGEVRVIIEYTERGLSNDSQD